MVTPSSVNTRGGVADVTDTVQRSRTRFGASVVHTVLSVNELLTPATSLEDYGSIESLEDFLWHCYCDV